ncbi:MAG: hypothetical protein ACO3VS_08025, partial [Limisphaerales bacterium]
HLDKDTSVGGLSGSFLFFHVEVSRERASDWSGKSSRLNVFMVIKTMGTRQCCSQSKMLQNLPWG